MKSRKSCNLVVYTIVVAVCLSLVPLTTPGNQVNPDYLFLIYRNGLWGYSDRNGNVVIKPQFLMGGLFDHGTAEVWRNDTKQKHLIDTRGNIIRDRNFASGYFSEGLVPVKIEEKYGYEDKQGRMIIFPRFEYAEDFSEGLAAVLSEGKWGYINPAGCFVINPQFDGGKDFNEGFAAVRLSAKTSQGDQLVSDILGGTYDFGFINKTGEVVIQPAYDYADGFSHGLAPVCNGGFNNSKCGYIDATGKLVIDLKFHRANTFSEGLASVQIGPKFGYIDTTGSVVIAPIFETALDFRSGLAYASVGKTTYGRGRRGVTVLTVTFHGKQGYIDKTGHFVSKKLSWNT